MKQNIYLFIVWSTASEYELEILEKIKQNFKILKQYRIHWDKEKFGENLTSFYEEDFTLDRFQLQQRGTEPFLAIIVEDYFPTYHVQSTRRGMELVNDKVFLLKNDVRNNLTHTFNFHCSINNTESRNNIIKLLGKSIEDFLSTECLDGEIVELKRNCMGVDGWKSLSELFYFLNETCCYVVLRMFDYLPDHHKMSLHGDIDILVNHLPSFICNIDPGKHCGENAYRFFNWMDIGDQRVLIHAKFVGDYYYDSCMQKKILETRILNCNGIYVPNTEMYFWSLLYHGLFHKENYLKYEEIFRKTAPELGIEYKNDKKYLCQLLSDYLRYNGYGCSMHLDAEAGSLNEKNVDGVVRKEYPKFYVYHDESSTLIVSEQLIRDNPKLFTRFIHPYDSIMDIEKHVLVNVNGICDEFNERLNKGEFLWRFSPRFEQLSELVYIHEPEQTPYFRRKFLIDNLTAEDETIIYEEEEHVDWIEGYTLDKLIKEAFLSSGNQDVESVVNILKPYIDYIFNNFKMEKDDCLQGIVWDAKPQNCMVLEKGEYKLFDLEVKSKIPVKKSFFIAKCVHQVSYPVCLSLTNSEELYIYKKLCEYFSVKIDNYAMLVKKHDDLVREILKSPPHNEFSERYFYLYSMNNDLISFTRNYIMRNSEHSAQLEERISQLDLRIHQLDERILQLDNVILQNNEEIIKKTLLIAQKDELLVQNQELIDQWKTVSCSRIYRILRKILRV